MQAQGSQDDGEFVLLVNPNQGVFRLLLDDGETTQAWLEEMASHPWWQWEVMPR
jgi:hypothetical protein